MRVQALPSWSQATLSRHAGDRRTLYTPQQLDAGTTGDKFWDAAQQQLATTGGDCYLTEKTTLTR